ncbi:uncharacterized protein L969DRAFT_86175 [Mixia osmundae IAM 14324]|uniref:Dolichyl-diphosphooligosaccharide--protein glycosyltransferase subunit 1 n=1 Tax=Mixia osmundae (strain CBS 9802 / IAM 14324 / JCM 22182 / KY 12970) TaxID=764103 RepID=G7DSB1_MIXOS|nr:uncharacterized protein L969DRAFT_86175 [Mixia osmundae IAM 14324]KEI40923.1 hypothetical protein L969DRAFT_86175 [Mixia osmundae IAM 14324]GAA93471.1 hypothetical protein E5Q_00112 [Mixia osmundae IAM 14324]
MRARLVALAGCLGFLQHTWAAASEQTVFAAPSPGQSAPSSYTPASRDQYEISSLARTIDLSGGSTARINTALTLVPLSASSEPATWHLGIKSKNLAHLSSLEAYEGTTKSSKKLIPVSKAGYDSLSETQYYAVQLPAPTADKIQITLAEIYLHVSTPKPAQLSQQTESQSLEWTGDLLAGLHHHTIKEARMRIKCPSPRLLNHSAPEGFELARTAGSPTLVFDAKSALPSSGESYVASVHYEQPLPLVTIRNLQRTVGVSQWSDSISVEDRMDLLNAGPALKGQFSRVDFQMATFNRRAPGAIPHIIQGITVQLPNGARSPYFTDVVGNVSTSHFRPSRGARGPSQIELAPRYPLLGGWSYDFQIGYILTASKYLRKAKGRSGRYVLSVPFLSPIANAAYDSVTTRVVLPEGASHIRVETPFAVDSETREIQFSYLDSTGRPAIVLQKSACSDKHAENVIISYTYSTAALVRKPLAVAAVAMSLFLATIGIRRFEWSFKR